MTKFVASDRPSQSGRAWKSPLSTPRKIHVVEKQREEPEGQREHDDDTTM